MFDYDHELQQRSFACDNYPVEEKVIVPFHVIKYILRPGGGRSAEPGMTLSCLVDIYTGDGTQISNCRGGRITRFLLGRGRLIDGLEVGLKGVKRDEKLRLLISPDYGYGGDEEVPLVPSETRLIFEITVMQMERVALERMT